MSQARIFQCPQCREYISSDAQSCRFCKTPVDPGVAQWAADLQDKENKQYRRKSYAKHMLIGAGIFAAGFIVTVGSFLAAAMSEGGGRYLITYGLMLWGGADFIYGLVGYLGELKSS